MQLARTIGRQLNIVNKGLRVCERPPTVRRGNDKANELCDEHSKKVKFCSMSGQQVSQEKTRMSRCKRDIEETSS